MRDSALISICVAHWNHCQDLLKPFIKNMLETTGDDVEIVIADNGSVDETQSFMESINNPRVKYVRLAHNRGFAGGSNAAAKAAKGKYLLFLNNDVVAHKKGWAKSLVEQLQELEDSGKKVVLGAHLVDHNTQTCVLDYPPITYLNGWCVFMNRKAYDEVGGWDERVGKGFFEDVLFSYELADKGYELREANVNLEHLGSQTIKGFNVDVLTRRALLYFRAKIIMLRLKKNKQKRIVFMCQSNYEFNDESWEGDGVGGAEASLIGLTRALAKKGYDVWVYNNTPLQGRFNGVYYAHLNDFKPSDYCDVFIVFRNVYNFTRDVFAKKKIFWSTDQYSTGNWMYMMPHFHKMVTISDFHTEYVKGKYPIKREFIQKIDLGLNFSDYQELPEKIDGKMIFCSVPHRGLGLVEDMFLKIREKVPHATLVITSDYTLWGATDPDNHQYRKLGDIPGIEFLGKINRSEVVRHQKESEIMFYPCTYDELFCVSALECIAAGAIPITTPVGALPTTVADSGALIYKDQGRLDDLMPKIAIELITNKVKSGRIRERGRLRVKSQYDWSVIADQWIELFNEKGGDTHGNS